MSNLSLLTIEAAYELPKAVRMDFRATTHHVKEIFSANLPSRFRFDGSGKLQITAGEAREVEPYRTMLGTSEYSIGGFDFAGYFSLSADDRGKVIVALIRQAFGAIAAQLSLAIGEVEDACNRTEQSGFRMRCEQKKLRKQVGALRVKVFRRLDHEVGEAWELQFEARDGGVLAVRPIRANGYVDLRDHYARAGVQADEYCLYDRMDRLVFSINVKGVGHA